MTGDRLFEYIEKLQAGKPWGRFLDAGTGRHSLAWVATLETSSWTAVTGDSERAARTEREFRDRIRTADRVVAGNWLDETFLHGQKYDVVLADYLLGALEGFAPYYQDRLFGRLRRHVLDRLYVVGLEPYETLSPTDGGRVICDIARLRDACILLAGDRCYREYPMEWVVRNLENVGFTVDEAERFPICYGEQFIGKQLDVCERKLPRIENRALAAGLKRRIVDLRRQATAYCRAHGGIRFGIDYVIAARPGEKD